MTQRNLNEALVRKYMQDIRAGRPLRALVLLHRPGQKYEIIAGHERAEAAKRCGFDGLDAYVVKDATPEQLENLRRADWEATGDN
jgi:ParB-like chromosome segregation protein Spo0J